MADGGSMTSLRNGVDEYLNVRRAMGFKLADVEAHLHRFLTFMEGRRASVITTKLAVAWAKEDLTSHPAQWAARLSIVRCFARFWSAVDARTEVPPASLLVARRERRAPHIYSDVEIEGLLREAAALRSRLGLRSRTLTTLLGLLASTGLRHGEALRLDLDDVDLEEGVLTVRETKFNKTRLVPLHPTTTRALAAYVKMRAEVAASSWSRRLLVKENGQPYGRHGTRAIFVDLCKKTGISANGARRGPRLQDMRHTFAVATVIGWYRRGVDVEARMPLLATYLGHGNPADTYWYLSNVPELVGLAAARMQRAAS